MRRSKVVFITVILSIFFAAALAWTPPGDINLRNYYDLINAVWVNSSFFNGTYYGVGSFLTGISTYNSSYDAHMTSNYSAKTDYVGNATERTLFTADLDTNASTACSGTQVLAGDGTCDANYDYNSSTQMQTAVNVTGLKYDFEVNNSDKLDNLDSTHFYPENKTMANATLFKDNVKAYFGTGYDFKIYYNGSHLYIGP